MVFRCILFVVASVGAVTASLNAEVKAPNVSCNVNSNPTQPWCESQSKGENSPHPHQSLADLGGAGFEFTLQITFTFGA